MTDAATLLATEDAVGLSALVRSGALDRGALLEAAIASAEAANPSLNFIAQWCPDRARAQAGRPLPEGPLAGVPFLVKDLGVDIADVPTGSGSRYFRSIPHKSSTLVERADAAGLLTFGKTTTPELGLSVTTESLAHGQTRNPWNLARTTGGSSGGAACAVAAGVVPLAHASDGGGSVRVPAACCGLFGLKPSRGLVPLGPRQIESWNGLTVSGPISRSVRDAAAFLDVLAGPEAGSRVCPGRPPGGYLAAAAVRPPRLRIAVMHAAADGTHVDAEVEAVLHDAVLLLTRLGHQLRTAAPDIDHGAVNDANVTNIAVSVGMEIARIEAETHDRADPGEIEQITAMWRHIGGTRTALDLQHALGVLQDTARRTDCFFDDHDILLSPTLAKPPILLGLLRLDQPSGSFSRSFAEFCPFTGFANFTGIPAISLPLGMTRDHLPVGIMAHARFGADALLLQLATEIEAEAPWAHRRPPLLP